METKKSKILVTGASGFVGYNLCKSLVKKYEIIGLTKTPSSLLASLGVKVITSISKHNTLINQIDYVVHCAANASFGNGDYSGNLKITYDLISCLNTKKIKLFILISSLGAVDRLNNDLGEKKINEKNACYPQSDYGKSKEQVENIVINSNLKYTILRPSMIIGNDMRLNSHFSFFAQKVFNKSLIRYFNWPGEFSFVDILDVIKSVQLSIDKQIENKIINISTSSITLGEFFKLCDPKCAKIDLFFLKKIIGYFPHIIPFKVKCLFFPILVSSNKKLKQIGWKPSVSPRKTLNNIINRESIRANVKELDYGYTIITGAASGLGLELSKLLYGLGRKLILLDKNINALKKLNEEFKGAKLFSIDLTNDKKVRELLFTIDKFSEPVTEIFLNAGIGLRGEFVNLTYEKQLKILHLNVLNNFYFFHFFSKKMVQYKFGRIVIIASSASFQPLPFMSIYAASKAFNLFMGLGINEELKEKGVNVLTVCSGGMKTNFQKTAGVKTLVNEKLLNPYIVAKKIIESSQKSKNFIIISFRAKVMYFFSKIMPLKISIFLWKKMMEKMR